MLAQFKGHFANIFYLLVYDAFEYWKKLVHILSTCDDALAQHSDIFEAYIGEFLFNNLGLVGLFNY